MIDHKINTPRKLVKGDKLAIVSLSSGILGEDYCRHYLDIGVRRLTDLGLLVDFMPSALKGVKYLWDNPKARAADLKAAFMDESIRGVICAIGGEDTYKLLPFLMDDEEFIEMVKKDPKIFMGYSDTTTNHLMFFKLGLSTFYGQSYITDFSEADNHMLPYTSDAVSMLFSSEIPKCIKPSKMWYMERSDFSANSVGVPRFAHMEKKGYELLQGKSIFSGRLLGGCIESLVDILTGTSHPDEKSICDRYELFPDRETWKGRILFIETSENKIMPEEYLNMLKVLDENIGFNTLSGILVGKPQDETYYDEYKDILRFYGSDFDVPILYNVNFGHAYPRCILPYNALVEVNAEESKISFLEKVLL